jgi:Icc-related predicted phosphoesterase
MRILCLSDIHGEAAGLSEAVSAEASEIDLVVIAGDVTHLGGGLEAETALSPLFSLGLPVVAVGGNADREGARHYLDTRGINLHERGLIIGSIGFMGLGGGTRSPFGTPWELEDAEATRCLAAGYAQIEGAAYKVLVSHAPPRNTKLDKNLARMHVGSEPVREFLLAGSVQLCLCGHIHEAWGEERVGRVHCINIGPFKSGRYALVTIDDGRASVTWRKR